MKRKEYKWYDLVTNNFQYAVDCGYMHSDCDCGEYPCRCRKIIDPSIESVDIDKFLDILTGNYINSKPLSEIDKYCVDRLIRIHKLYDKDSFEISIGGGYYGEEIDEVLIKDDIQTKLIEIFTKLDILNNDIDKIFLVLEEEYGFILDKIKDFKNAHIINVDTSKIIFSNEYHIKNIKGSCMYRNYKLPVAVCYLDSDFYKIIDGYHRTIANKHNIENKIVLLS